MTVLQISSKSLLDNIFTEKSRLMWPCAVITEVYFPIGNVKCE